MSSATLFLTAAISPDGIENAFNAIRGNDDTEKSTALVVLWDKWGAEFESFKEFIQYNTDKEINECDDCGTFYFTADGIVTHDDKHICGSCIDDYRECSDTSAWYSTDDMVCTANGDYICQESYDDNYFSCECCSEIYHNDDCIRTASNEYICNSCCSDNYSRCDDCGDIVHSENTHYVAALANGDSGSICSCCYENGDYTWDEDTDELVHVDHVSSSLIHKYHSTTVTAECSGFKTGKKEHKRIVPCSHGNKIDRTRYLGIELEVETKNYDRDSVSEDVINSLENMAILMEDGSLDDERGFEIISIPATLQFHRENWDEFFNGPAKSLLSFNSHSGSCGMHIHVSTASMSELTIGKIREFVNSDSNSYLIRKIAQRECNSYCRTSADEKVKNGKSRSNSRYSAINTDTRGQKTVEFRIFKGTVNKEGFFRNLEFVAACVEYCETHSYRDLDYTKFAAWMDLPRNSAAYPLLNKWLYKRGFIAAQVKLARAA